MIKVAITGNIASGKSTVENVLREQGYKVFDTDEIAHKILEQSQEIVDLFKDFDVMCDGKISRKKIGKIVFKDDVLRKKLEKILHPKLKEEIRKIFENLREDIVFVSIPLLYETGMESMFDKVVLVYCDDDLRLQRLIKRNNLTTEDAKNRMNAQMSQDLKIKKADYVIDNWGSESELYIRVKEVLELLQK